MRHACERADIEPAITFHILRHTYASRLAMRGVPLNVIAKQLGHSDTRMTEKHYAHLAPSYQPRGGGTCIHVTIRVAWWTT